MKAIAIILATVVSSMVYMACQPAKAKYIDLTTGDEVTLERDENSGQMVNVETGEPVRLYVNAKSEDTIFGPSGTIVNDEVIHFDDGLYVWAGDEEFKQKISDGGEYEEKYGDVYKLKIESDGDLKEKFGDDYKVKIDEDGDYKEKHGDDYKAKSGSNGSYKIKRGENYKKEVEKDGDVKIKNGNVKIEIDGETGEREVKVDD
jgi:hypothetical protein